MTREVKFRAWNVKDEKMEIAHALFFSRNTGNFVSCNYEDNDDYIVMQYTGLKDKNGQEIFEGDIIEWIEEPTNKNTFHEICWIDKEGCWGTKDSIWLCNTNMNYRVIGNIWENPELLEGNDQEK